jgi:hypothetical protein
MGLARAYHQNRQSSDPAMIAALEKAKIFLLSKTDSFAANDGALAIELDRILGGTTCVNYIRSRFYDKLASGTYYDARTGRMHSTASYIQSLRNIRAAQGIANLAAWDVGMGLYDAFVIGADTGPWIAAAKAEIDELDGNYTYDVLGLAGAIFGLAAVGEDYNPQAGTYAAASSLSDLAVTLAGYQMPSGGFTWHAQFMIEGVDESVLETAYAVMALSAVDRYAYISQIDNVSSYLRTVQLATGGWENYITAGEENRITGDALRGLLADLGALADFNNDGGVDFADFAIFAGAWNSGRGQQRWNPMCDMSIPADGFVGVEDLAVFAEHWLEGLE